MKALKSKVTNGVQFGSYVPTCDNSGAKIAKIITVMGAKTVKSRYSSGGVGSLVQVAVKKGTKDVQAQVFFAVVVRQRREYRRPNGMRIKFEDNAAIILKDDKRTPKGTIFKGPIAKEACERWPGIAKVARIVV